jgi:hypothetical protein
LDSEQKAKDVVLCRYKHYVSRFSVKFTQQLVEELKSEPPPPQAAKFSETDRMTIYINFTRI